jgi:ATP-dependent RNA helicase SUPV3L1/SUV3
VPGSDVFAPAVRPLTGDLVEPGARDRIARRLRRWIEGEVAIALKPLLRLREARLEGAARGIAYQLVEAMGNLPRAQVAALADHLSPADRRRLAGLGVRLGQAYVYVQPALKPRLVAMRALLWAVANRLIVPPALPNPGSPSVVRAEGVPEAFYAAIGYAPTGRRAVRVDRLEALEEAAAALAAEGPFRDEPRLAQLAGCARGDLTEVLGLLGYRAVIAEDGRITFHRPRRRGPRRRRDGGRADSPFAKLKLLSGRP